MPGMEHRKSKGNLRVHRCLRNSYANRVWSCLIIESWLNCWSTSQIAYLIFLCPPMSQTFSLKPGDWTLLMLKPWSKMLSSVKILRNPLDYLRGHDMWNIFGGQLFEYGSLAGLGHGSSRLDWRSIRVDHRLTLSRPSKSIRSSLFEVDLNFFKSDSRPCVDYEVISNYDGLVCSFLPFWWEQIIPTNWQFVCVWGLDWRWDKFGHYGREWTQPDGCHWWHAPTTLCQQTIQQPRSLLIFSTSSFSLPIYCESFCTSGTSIDNRILLLLTPGVFATICFRFDGASS